MQFCDRKLTLSRKHSIGSVNEVSGMSGIHKIVDLPHMVGHASVIVGGEPANHFELLYRKRDLLC